MVGAGGLHLVAGRQVEQRRGELLQPALVIGTVGLGSGQAGPEGAEHQRGGPLEPRGQVGRPDDRLHGVGQDGWLLAPAGELLAASEQKVLAHAEALRHLGQRHGVHHRLADLGERAFVEVGVHPVHVIGDDDAENGVTEELEALVGGVAGVLGAPGAVHQGRG